MVLGLIFEHWLFSVLLNFETIMHTLLHKKHVLILAVASFVFIRHLIQSQSLIAISLL